VLELAPADLTQAATLRPEMGAGVRALVSCSAVKVQPKEGDTPDRAKYYQGGSGWALQKPLLCFHLLCFVLLCCAVLCWAGLGWAVLGRLGPCWEALGGAGLGHASALLRPKFHLCLGRKCFAAA
jgi:hypothetical protein